ncbi:MAG: anthranilate phosphoribosyltransferase [Candidatus Mycalebacterium zealandia]|nr:MAG: anthranilate phosphoribosyltransferase [Candidatus Mycalebacterium zealandia]
MPEISNLIEQLAAGKNLNRKTVAGVFRTIMDGALTPAQTASFLTALRIKGETAEELAGAAEAMISRARAIKGGKGAVDLCGTGGDSKGSFNISTTASFIAAGADVPVAKHGNRSVSSPVGSADVLEAAGVKIDMDAKTAGHCLEKAGITFLFAPLFHPSMKNVAQVRKEMGVRTVFNILGPLVNPARVKNQLIGVPSREIMKKIAAAAKGLGLRRCMVVSGKDGMDEITVTGKTDVLELKNGSVRQYTIDPSEFGIRKSAAAKLKGGRNSRENASIMKAVLYNRESGAKTDAALLNAAAAIYVSGKKKNMKSAFEAAKHSLESGAAMLKLKELTKFSANKKG